MNKFNPMHMPMQMQMGQGFGTMGEMGQGFDVMGGVGQTFGNPQMGICMNPMNMGMIPEMMRMIPGMMGMTKEQKAQYYRTLGYLYAKFLLKNGNNSKKQVPAPIVTIPEGPASGELNIKFNKRGFIINIKMDAEEMVAVLINEYFINSGTKTGNFTFNGKTLFPSDISSLAEVGLRNNSVIFVS